MNTARIVGIILIIVGIVLGFMGITTISDSTASAEVLGVELNASDEGGQMTGYLYLGLGVLLLLGGIYSVSKKG